MADSFFTRFNAVRSIHGPLVWGLDPSGARRRRGDGCRDAGRPRRL